MDMQRLKVVIVCIICSLVAWNAAAADPFSEVPANDPAYKSLALLSEAGWRAAGMNVPRRVMVLSRYEFALEVSRVIQRVSQEAKKDAAALRSQPQALRALRDLTTQFRTELEKLGVDVATARKLIDDALKVEPPTGTEAEPEDPIAPRPVSSSPPRSAFSQPSRFVNLPPLALTSEMNPWMKDFLKSNSKPIVMTSIGSGLLAVDDSLFRDALTPEVQRLMTTEFKLPVTDKLSLSASLAQLRSLTRDGYHRAWSADAQYALGRWKLDASLRFAGSDQLANAFMGVPQAHPASVWRSLGGGVAYMPKEWLTISARIAGVTDLMQLQSNYIISSGGVGISLRDKIALEVNWLHVNPFDPAQSSSLLTRLGLRTSISPSMQWQLFYHKFDDAMTTSAARPTVIGTQVSVKF
jgi:hypothetical protein